MSLLVKYTKQELITKLNELNLPIVIYGAGVSGQALLLSCTEVGIKIDAFCDNNIKKKVYIIKLFHNK